MYTVFWCIYLILSVVGIHVAVNYLCSVASQRSVDFKDILFALLCVLFHLPMFLLIYVLSLSEGKLKRKKEQAEKLSKSNIIILVQSFIPDLIVDKTTIQNLSDSSNPYSILFAEYLLKNTSKYKLDKVTAELLYQHYDYLATVKEVDVTMTRVNLRYNQSKS